MLSMLVSKLIWLSWPFCSFNGGSDTVCTSVAVFNGTGSVKAACASDGIACAGWLFVASTGFVKVVS